MKTYQLFLLICASITLVLITTYLSLNVHIAEEALKWETGALKSLQGHEFFHKPRAAGLQPNHNDTSSVVLQEAGAGNPPVVSEAAAATRANAAKAHKSGDENRERGSENVKETNLRTPRLIPDKQEQSVRSRGVGAGAGAGAGTSTEAGGGTARPERSDGGCWINPLVKYWDEKTEAYVSPLRAVNGLAVSAEEQRFVVFEPDQGGWNNIRMALEVVVLLALATGRVLVLPPHAVLYLLHHNKKWGDNKSSVEDYFDFRRLRERNGLQTMPMRDFLQTVAAKGLLKLPLPGNDTSLAKQPLWKYLEKACFVRPWSPGKLYIGLDVVGNSSGIGGGRVAQLLGDFKGIDPKRTAEFSLAGKRELLPYGSKMQSERALYFPGGHENRLLTHFYSYLFFARAEESRRAKRFMRDRMRYHDTIFCVGSRIVEKLLQIEALMILQATPPISKDSQNPRSLALTLLSGLEMQQGGPGSGLAALGAQVRQMREGQVAPNYVSFHIRRGDFQQKHTRLAAEKIIELTRQLVPDASQRVAYIATDERNRSFFAPFEAEYAAVYYLEDLQNGTGVHSMNQNYAGMVEQIVCAAADVFIGTPLSTFTAYISRLRGYMNRTISNLEGRPEVVSLKLDDVQLEKDVVDDDADDGAEEEGVQYQYQDDDEEVDDPSPSTDDQQEGDAYVYGSDDQGGTYAYGEPDNEVDDKASGGGAAEGGGALREGQRHSSARAAGMVLDRSGLYWRTYYFMQHHMHQLHTKPFVHFPLWTRDFVDAFRGIDDDVQDDKGGH